MCTCSCRSASAWVLPPLMLTAMWVLPYIGPRSTFQWAFENFAFALVSFCFYAAIVSGLLTWQKLHHWGWYAFTTFVLAGSSLLYLKFMQVQGEQEVFYLGVKIMHRGGMTYEGMALFLREGFGLGLVYAAAVTLFWCLRERASK